MYILLVYDDIIRHVYGKYLEKEGFSVDFASSGEDAFDIVSATPEKYEFILMDLKMNIDQWDGIKTTEEMLKINRDLSIIIFSKKDESSYKETRFRALSAGALRYEIRGEAHEVLSLIQNLISEVKILRELRCQLNEFTAKQRWLQSTLFASNIGITIIDRTYRIHYMNQYQQNMMSEIAQHALFCYQLISGVTTTSNCCKFCTIQEIFTGEKTDTTGTLLYLPIRKRWQYLQIFASPLVDNQGNIVNGKDGKPIAVILAFRLLDSQSAGQLHYKVRLKAILHSLWQDFDHIRLYLAAPDLNQLKIIEAAGHNSEFKGIYNLSDDPCSHWCLEHKQARIWDKNRDEEAKIERFSHSIGILTLMQWLDYPLFNKEKLIGWISADNATAQSPINSQHVTEKINPCADEIIRIFSSADFDQTLDNKSGTEQKDLIDIDIKLSSVARDPVEGLGILIDEIKRICQADRAFIRYLKEDKLILGPIAGKYPLLASKEVFLADNFSLFALAARKEEPLFIPKTESDPYFLKLKGYFQQTHNYTADIFNKIKAAIYYPIKLGTRLVGIISVHSYTEKNYSEANEKIRIVMKQISQKAALLINDYVPYIQLQRALKEAKKQHKEAEAQRQRFEKLLSALGDEVCIINKKDIITFVNDIKRKKFQKAGEDITDKNHYCWQIFEQRDKHCDICSCSEARNTKQIEKMHAFAYNKHDMPFTVEVTASPLIYNGVVDEVIEVCRDITAEERHKKELEVVDALSGSATTGLSIEAYLDRACTLIKEVILPQECSLFLWDPDWHRLQLKASTATEFKSGDNKQREKYFYQDNTTRLFCHFTTGVPVKGCWEELKDGVNPERESFEALYMHNSPEALTHYLHVPLKTFINESIMGSNKQVMPLGMIEVVNKIVQDRAGYCMDKFGKPFRLDPDGFTQEDINFLNKLGDQISSWVHNQLLLAQKKTISDKMAILADTVAAIAKIKTLDQLAYLTLLTVTHKEGLSNDRAFLLLPAAGESKEYFIYARGLKNKKEADNILYSKIPDYKSVLTEFKTNSIPQDAFWNINDFQIKDRDLENSYFLQETMKSEHKIKIFTQLNNTHPESGIRIIEDCLSPFDKECLARIGHGEEICTAVLPVAEKEYGFLMVDNIYERKRINQVTLYLLRQYTYGLSAAIQRWYATTHFKTLTAQAAHEIRGALQSIMNYNALYRYQLTAAEIARGQQQIEKEVNRASDTVTSFIEYVKAESRYWELKREYASIYEIINEAVLSVEPEAKQEGISITLHKSDTIMLNVDPVRIRMVFLNLLRNALKAIPKGLPPERKKIDIEYKAEQQKILITIKDQGTGMSPEEVDKIFEPFSGTGTGLGLTLSMQIIEKHHGSIKVESLVDHGTTISITLPKE